MKYNLTILFVIATCSIINSQSLPFDFENSIVTADFIDFDGGTATVIDNPQPNGINTSSKVAQIVRNGGEIWAGSKIDLAANLDFSTENSIVMKVFTTAPIGTTVKFKLEGINVSTERDVQTTVTNEWEEMTWDFTGEPSIFNSVVFMFDFGNIGDGSTTSTFLFDDVEQFFGGFQIDFPVDFEDPSVNYTMSDFGGNSSSLTTDPEDETNMVIQAIKTEQAATWAGTTIGTPAGFATNLPLTLSSSKMNVKVWSPESGTPIRLKVEDSNDPTHTCETETNTTVGGGWEVIEFDFINQAPGTELLSIGLEKGWTYNMASIFFNFGTEGVTAGEKTYYFDDVKFGEKTLNIENTDIQEIKVYPNPSYDLWNIFSDNNDIKQLELYNLEGELIKKVSSNSEIITLDSSFLVDGIYICKVSSNSGASILRLIKN